ncbi:MAG: LysM domain-containing protein [Solirubrobacteraceae bacterium]
MVRNSARFLAPLALAAVALGVYLVVHSTHPGATRRRKLGPKFYVVKPGDTLSAISARTKVSLTRLTTLNPALSAPYNLQTGQRLRLRR